MHVRFGREVRRVGETTSTIDLAWEWLKAGGPPGGVVIAERQTKGRGRLGRVWASPAGGLWMSVMARPDLEVQRVGLLAVTLALAAAEGVLATTGTRVGLRWPNDIVLGCRKVGGVLVETETMEARVTQAVLSLGLNVNVPVGQLPKEVRTSATSLLEVTGREHSTEAVAAEVLNRLDQFWPALLAEDHVLRSKWHAWDVLAGHPVSIAVGGAVVQGIAAGISPQGGLQLLVGGETRTVLAGEVHHVSTEPP